MPRRRKRYQPTEQYMAIMTMTHFKTEKKRAITRTFGPFNSRSAAASFIRAMSNDIRRSIELEYMREVSKDEPLRYDSVEYTFATSELWS